MKSLHAYLIGCSKTSIDLVEENVEPFLDAVSFRDFPFISWPTAEAVSAHCFTYKSRECGHRVHATRELSEISLELCAIKRQNGRYKSAIFKILEIAVQMPQTWPSILVSLHLSKFARVKPRI